MRDKSFNFHSQPLLQEVESSPSSEVDVVGAPNTSSLLKDHLVHKARISNLSDFEQNSKTRINFSPSGDKVAWSDVDIELSEALPRLFNQNLINSNISTSDLSKKFDNWLHAYFLEKFGSIPIKVTSRPKKKKVRHRGLERLRRKKNLLSKDFKILVKAGLADSPIGALAKAEWKKTLRLHNSLRRSVSKAMKKKAEAAASKTFKKNPNMFASRLFTSSSNAKPTFSEEEATDYFSKTYRDEGREKILFPLTTSQDLPLP